MEGNAPPDALASVVVFLVALPLCIGITIASGAPTGSGIVSTIVFVSLLTGVIVGLALALAKLLYTTQNLETCLPTTRSRGN